ncbi:MAG: anti-sigma F factor antagonist [Clostridiaceae bacterium]|nr:anti-sigma F factor antagonist [Clostridiaceae bacterium]
MWLEKKGEALIVRLEGELDHHYASKIKDGIDGAIMVGDVRKIIFDFSRVVFMDSSGIGTIIGRYKLMQAVGGSVCAFGMSKRLNKIIAMSGILKIITIYKTEQEATGGCG